MTEHNLETLIKNEAENAAAKKENPSAAFQQDTVPLKNYSEL